MVASIAEKSKFYHAISQNGKFLARTGNKIKTKSELIRSILNWKVQRKTFWEEEVGENGMFYIFFASSLPEAKKMYGKMIGLEETPEEEQMLPDDVPF